MSSAIIRYYRCRNRGQHKAPGVFFVTPVSVPADGPWLETVPCADCGEPAVGEAGATRVWTTLRLKGGWATTEFHSEPVEEPK